MVSSQTTKVRNNRATRIGLRRRNRRLDVISRGGPTRKTKCSRRARKVAFSAGQRATSVAEALDDKGIPFFFAAGYGAPGLASEQRLLSRIALRSSAPMLS